MEINPIWIFKLFGAANAVALSVVVWFTVAPFIVQTSFAVTIGGVRYGYGSDGWTVQEIGSYKILNSGWFPWHRVRRPDDPLFKGGCSSEYRI